MTFASFLGSLKCDLQLLITVVLTLGVITVNGWTDAPNAIASAVVTRALKPKTAVLTAAVMNFFGVFLTSSVNYEVAKTVYSIADFGSSLQSARTALAAAMTAVVLWAVAAWCFGIPTSESHALIAGITGASVSLHGSFSGVSAYEWGKVLSGLFLSSVLGFFCGFIISRAVVRVFSGVRRKKANSFFDRCEIVVAAATAFFHGAQDGQKFIGMMLLCISFSNGGILEKPAGVPFFLVVICSVFMASGTAMGGKKIIKSVGMDMASLEKYQGFSSDAASVLSLLFSTVFGFPVSTTHVKTTAVMGVAAARGIKNVNWKVAQNMLVAWTVTFPACFLLSFVVTKFYFIIFL